MRATDGRWFRGRCVYCSHGVWEVLKLVILSLAMPLGGSDFDWVLLLIELKIKWSNFLKAFVDIFCLLHRFYCVLDDFKNLVFWIFVKIQLNTSIVVLDLPHYRFTSGKINFLMLFITANWAIVWMVKNQKNFFWFCFGLSVLAFLLCILFAASIAFGIVLAVPSSLFERP